MMGILFSLALLYGFYWSIKLIFSPLTSYDGDGVEYGGALLGWCMAITFFLWLFGAI